jgi:hypothetical protein
MSFRVPRTWFIMIVAWLVGFVGTGPVAALDVSRGSLVLSLNTRGGVHDPTLAREGAGSFGDEASFFETKLVAVDSRRNFYLADPLDGNYYLLKKFTPDGQLGYVWSPLNAGTIRAIAASSNGLVWVGMESLNKYRGLPVVAFEHGQKLPVLDWRDEVPSTILSAIKTALAKEGKEWQAGWWVRRIAVSDHVVDIELAGPAVGEENHIVRNLLLLLDSGATKVIRCEVLPTGANLQLSPSGRIWTSEANFVRSPEMKWDSLWFYLEGTPKPPPFFTRKNDPEPFRAVFLLGAMRRPPIVRTDGANNRYVFWRRRSQADNAHDRNDLESAVTIYDNKGRLISCLPWMTAPDGDDWIKPAPDGSGFYRIEYAPKKVNIYFHPLPGPGKPAETKQ